MSDRHLRPADAPGRPLTTPRPLNVAITGAAGQIAYSLLFKVASGLMLGLDQPVSLRLLEVPAALGALKGVVMELEDCAFPLVSSLVASSDPHEAFGDADVAVLVGARPRSKGMERRDLLEANGAIFSVQGQALAASAKPRREGARGGQPGQHQLPDRRPQRRDGPDGLGPAAVRGHDPPRP